MDVVDRVSLTALDGMRSGDIKYLLKVDFNGDKTAGITFLQDTHPLALSDSLRGLADLIDEQVMKKND